MDPLDNSLFGKLVRTIRQQFGAIQAVYVFGSQVTGAVRPDSDLDLALLTPAPLDAEKLFALTGKLSGIAKRDVDLVNLRAASTVMRSQVIAKGRRIYCSDEAACEQFEDLVYSSYARLNEERRHILQDIQIRGRIHD